MKPDHLPPPLPLEMDEDDPRLNQLIYGVHTPLDGGEEICLVEPGQPEQEPTPPAGLSNGSPPLPRPEEGTA